jgi:hypothetical protein
MAIYGDEPWTALQRKVMGRAGETWARPHLEFGGAGTTRVSLAQEWMRQAYSEKFVRVNVLHRNSIEFRQGCASLRKVRILGRLEFVEALCAFAKENPKPYAPEAEVADFSAYLARGGYDFASELLAA